MNCIIIDKSKKMKLWKGEDIEFDTEIYNNSGIVSENIAGFTRYALGEDNIDLLQIYIRPEEREKRLGGTLMKKMEAIAKKNKKVKLTCRNGSEAEDPMNILLTKSGLELIAPKQWMKILK